MRLAIAFILGATLATPIVGAVVYAAVGNATREIDERHTNGHAYETAICEDMAQRAVRITEEASMLTWARRGPTGGVMPGMMTSSEGAE